MEAGDIVTVDGVKCVVRCIASLVSFCDTTGKMPYLIAALDKIEEPKPDIRWERIPDYAWFITVHIDGISFSASRVFGCPFNRGDDWVFPNWRDFIGQMFERPEGGNA